MSLDYTDHDTERVRQAQASSAGQPTQYLGEVPVPSVSYTGDVPMQTGATVHGGRNNLSALALIAIGMLLLLGRFALGGLDLMPGLVLLTIGSCLLFFAFWQRIYGLLIPGCILAGLSIGVTFAAVTGGVSVLWGLSLGFLAIYLVGKAVFNEDNIWPIFPAVPLFGVGVITAASQLPELFAGGLVWLPLMLIVLGLFLGWRRTA